MAKSKYTRLALAAYVIERALRYQIEQGSAEGREKMVHYAGFDDLAANLAAAVLSEDSKVPPKKILKKSTFQASKMHWVQQPKLP